MKTTRMAIKDNSVQAVEITCLMAMFMLAATAAVLSSAKLISRTAAIPGNPARSPWCH